MQKVFSRVTLAVALMLIIGSLATVSFAQEADGEMSDTSMVDEAGEAVEGEVVTDGEEPVADEATPMDETVEEGAPAEADVVFVEDLTETEALQIVEEAVEITEEEAIEELLTGEVLVTTETYVVIETAAGEVLKVRKRPTFQIIGRRMIGPRAATTAMPGQMITFVPQNVMSTSKTGASFDGSTLVLGEDSFNLSDETVVVEGVNLEGLEGLESLEESTLVTVVTDESGEVVLVTLSEGDVTEKNNTTVLIVIVAILVFMIAKMLMKKKKAVPTA